MVLYVSVILVNVFPAKHGVGEVQIEASARKLVDFHMA
jgi:hypothetical protein